MKLYRFSPIKNLEELLEAIRHIHFECYKLCKESIGHYLPNAGNIGVFCHYDEEFELLKKIREEITEPSSDPNQKYFHFLTPVKIPSQNNVPSTTYSYLYVRKPDPYRHHVGDVDFHLLPEKYAGLKDSLLSGDKIKGARIYERSDHDMIELYDPDVDALGYVHAYEMTEIVKFKLPTAPKI